MRAVVARVLLFVGAFAGCVVDIGPDQMKVVYDQNVGRVLIAERQLGAGEEIFLRVRRGHFGTLDCRDLVGVVEPVFPEDRHLVGPEVPPEILSPYYGPEWAEAEPTPEMLASIEAGTDTIIDVCRVKDNDVVERFEKDFYEAWDDGKADGIGGKADGENGEVAIHSPQVYGERCVAELGEIPFFEKLGEGSYGTYSCLDSVPIPMTVTDENGNVTNPEGVVPKCDEPQYIYSLCEPGPRVASRVNEQGTRWVLLCRKSVGGYSSDEYNDIAMIGHNPYTGKTCFFQNALYSKRDGGHVPHPADREKSANLWSGVHGGIGSGIECARCHDADPFIHTPWIDGALDANGNTVVPKMGQSEDYPLGANDAPYHIVNTAGNGWSMPKQIVAPEANACLKCHRMGNQRWLEWATRLDGTDTSFRNITTDAYLQFERLHWMPPDLQEEGLTAESWAASRYGQALEFLKACRNASCLVADIPGAGGSGGGGTGGTGAIRNPVGLPDDELALRALQLLGANVPGATDRCGECHALTRTNLRRWQELTDTAVATCLNEGAGAPASERVSDQTIANGELRSFGPYEAAAGPFQVVMSGTGDADLYVRRNAAATQEQYDCRPYQPSSAEECTLTGPGSFYIAVAGFGEASTISLEISYAAPGSGGANPRQMVDCMRHDPTRSDSPYTPVHVGIYSAAAHLSWFQALFQAAWSGSATWQVEYAKFKNRVSMPKGNHARYTQDELDIIAEWFARGLPRLDTLPEEQPPSSCTDSVASTELQGHLDLMQVRGWKAENAARGLNMLDLSGFPRASSKAYATEWEAAGPAGSVIRVLRELSFGTSFWMRSSADGRFAANGADGGAGAMISDLMRGRDIPTHAAYDPGFFPDNSGWVFQGTSLGAGFCSMSLLTSNPNEITFSEPQCSAASSVGLYQHLGADMDGGDYFVINSQFTSDNGGQSSTTEDPSAGFSSTAEIKITPLSRDGERYVQGSSVTLTTPFEGDTILSPSTKLAVGRLSGPGGAQLGYVIRKLNATRAGAGYSITAPEVGRVCVSGGKPAVSFDERFLVYHHYEAAGTANIHLIDLRTGQRQQVTNMRTGQYALFPHFRSDGWIYFLVRDAGADREYVVASDAAIVLGG